MRKTLAVLFGLSLLTIVTPALAATTPTDPVTSTATAVVQPVVATPTPNYPEPPDWFD